MAHIHNTARMGDEMAEEKGRGCDEQIDGHDGDYFFTTTVQHNFLN